MWRWLVRVGILLLLALALYVLGRGLGLLSSTNGDGGPRDPTGASTPPRQEAVAASPMPPAAPRTATDMPAAPPGSGPADGQRVASPAPPAGSPAPPAFEPAGVDDRSTSLLSLARSALEAGRPGTALATLAEVERLHLGPKQREQARTLMHLAQAGLEVETAALMTDVRCGRILAARHRLAELVHDRVAAVTAAVDAAVRAAGWPAVTSAARQGAYVPKAAPLARERLVRTFRDGIELQARVVDARPHEVTLKVVEGRAMTFPSFPVTRIEPVEATAAEAVELGLAALAAGDVPLARLWLCAAVASGAAGPRLAELRELLP
jgi:hypothetical protein